jgi:hypothetical protein
MVDVSTATDDASGLEGDALERDTGAGMHGTLSGLHELIGNLIPLLEDCERELRVAGKPAQNERLRAARRPGGRGGVPRPRQDRARRRVR